MLDAFASARPDGPAESYAARIARIANSTAAQGTVDQAPPLTRRQLDTLRAVFAGRAAILGLTVAPAAAVA